MRIRRDFHTTGDRCSCNRDREIRFVYKTGKGHGLVVCLCLHCGDPIGYIPLDDLPVPIRRRIFIKMDVLRGRP